ncbi:MAG TPA: hypothetical protein VFN55_09730 [Solirubrobacteraceae bacterium]|nr:hypothetical protein [Solirubrobacteraceae bacterium]
MRRSLLLVAVAAAALLTPAAASALRVQWMHGAPAPGTPARYDRVGVLKVGPAHARNVLVLVPGTSAGSAYFVPLAKWVTSRAPGWQVWSVERRENLLEDQSVLDAAKSGHASAQQLFDYYLGYLAHPVAHHFTAIPNGEVGFAKQWGMTVAIGDLRRVVTAAHRLGGRVVLGGHSLGGGVVTAYASWDFGGHPGAAGLSGLVYIDGGSFGTETAAAARAALTALDAPTASPWLSFGGIPAPLAGIFSATGSTAALKYPDAPSLAQRSGLLTSLHLTPTVPVTNLAQYGYALNVGTSPSGLAAAQAHLGKGVAARGPVHGWNGAGALTPLRRFAQMFSGTGVSNADGTEWYFPQRLTDDLGAVGNGTLNPAQQVLGLKALDGRRLPHSLRIYAFGAALGGRRILQEAAALARQSRIPRRQVTLVDRHATYAHNDPNGAYPHNAFVDRLVPFLDGIAREHG